VCEKLVEKKKDWGLRKQKQSEIKLKLIDKVEGHLEFYDRVFELWLFKWYTKLYNYSLENLVEIICGVGFGSVELYLLTKLYYMNEF
jgi:hypothetical protein